MSALSEIQKSFLYGLQNESLPTGLSDQSRFDTYIKAYKMRLKDSLQEDFPQTLSAMSDAHSVMESYIKAYPSTFWTVGEFAKFFPDFLCQKFPGDQNIEYLARLEWAQWLAFSIGEPVLPPVALLDKDINILLNPSLQIVSVGVKKTAVFYFAGELHEHQLQQDDLGILESLQAFVPISKLDVAEERLIKFLSKWSSVGVVIGFREVT